MKKVGDLLHLEYSKGKDRAGLLLTLTAAQGELMSTKLRTHTLYKSRLGRSTPN